MISRTSESRFQRASPFAIVSAFALVGVAIFFGVFGPQIGNRGNLVVESTLSGVLRSSVDYYQRERFQLEFGMAVPVPGSDAIRRELDERFAGQARYLDLSALGLRPVGIDSSLPEAGVETGPRYAVIHRTKPASDGSSKCAAVIYVKDARPRIAHDDFGVPEVMGRGEVYRFQITGSTFQSSWSAAWYEGAVLHLLIAESEDVLDQILQVVTPDVDVESVPLPIA